MKKNPNTAFPILGKRVFFALIAMFLFLHNAAGAETEPDTKRHHEDSLFMLTENGLFSIELLLEDQDLREGKNKAELIIYDTSGNDVEDAEVLVTAQMPETGEKPAEEPVVTEMGGGFYRTDNIVINTAGHWEIQVTIKKYGLQDRAVFDFPQEKAAVAEEQTVPDDQPEETVSQEEATIVPAGQYEKYRTVLRPLPALPPIPADNSITPDKVRLGKMLFWDRRVSKTGTASCVFCHHPSYYGAEPMRTSAGIDGDIHPRNAQTVLNAAFLNPLFWTGEPTDPEHQVLSTVKSHAALGSVAGEVAERLNRISEYRELSIKVFSEPLTEENMGKAMASYIWTLTTPDYPLARWLQGDENALTETQKNGMALFVDKGCIGCHSGPAFSSAAPGPGTPASAEELREEGSPGRYLYKVMLPGAENDAGLANKTEKEEDRYFFKVPLLLNVAKTPPYTHAGLIDGLHDMVLFMSEHMLNIELSSDEADDIAAFLHTLTGELPQDFMTAPVLPVGINIEVQKSNSAEVQKSAEEQNDTKKQEGTAEQKNGNLQ